MSCFDRAAIEAHVSLIHDLASGCEGSLVLAPIEEGKPPHIQRFKIGAVTEMVDVIMGFESAPNLNLYIPWSLVRHDLPRGKKGGEGDIVAVLAGVGDIDNDKYSLTELPLQAPYIIESSTGNFQTIFPFSRALSVDDAKPVLLALANAIGGDQGTKDASHVWRIPGTLNHPTKVKLARGRSPIPQSVTVKKSFDGQLLSPQEILDALPGKPNGHTKDEPPHIDDVRAPPEGLLLPDEVALDHRHMQALRDGVPDGRRSEVFHAVVCGLRDDNGLVPGQIETLMRRYPQGIAAKYAGRVRKIIDASWRKVGNEDHDVVRDGNGDIIARDIGLVLYEVPKRQPGGKCRFDLIPFDKITFSTAPAYLVKGLIPRVGLCIFWGPPKCGKSFLVFDIMMHVALGWKYRGRKVRQGGVVYCALEGCEGFKNRVEAFRVARLADCASEVLFHLMASPMTMVADHVALIAAIRATLGDTKPAAIVIDTLNRSLAGSESDDRDMAAYIKAADAVREAFSCAVVIVHHCGHEGTRPRGHSSLMGALDAQTAVKRDDADNIVATVELMKDGTQGDEFVSRLEVVEIGIDDDGDLITSCVVAPVDGYAPRPQRNTKSESLLPSGLIRRLG